MVVLPPINDHQFVAHLIKATGGNADSLFSIHILNCMMHGQYVSKRKTEFDRFLSINKIPQEFLTPPHFVAA